MSDPGRDGTRVGPDKGNRVLVGDDPVAVVALSGHRRRPEKKQAGRTGHFANNS